MEKKRTQRIEEKESGALTQRRKEATKKKKTEEQGTKKKNGKERLPRHMGRGSGHVTEKNGSGITTQRKNSWK